MWVCLPVYFSGPATNHQRVKENVFLPFSLKTLYFLQSLVNTSSESEGGFTLLSCGSWPEHGYSLGCLKVCGPEQVISPLQCFSHLLRGLIIFTWQGGVWIKLDTTLRKIKPPHKTWLLLWLQKKNPFWLTVHPELGLIRSNSPEAASWTSCCLWLWSDHSSVRSHNGCSQCVDWLQAPRRQHLLLQHKRHKNKADLGLVPSA